MVFLFLRMYFFGILNFLSFSKLFENEMMKFIYIKYGYIDYLKYLQRYLNKFFFFIYRCLEIVDIRVISGVGKQICGIDDYSYNLFLDVRMM